MAELVDALGSGSSESYLVGVRIPLRAQYFQKSRIILNKSPQNLSRAYKEAEEFAKSHYENFPVVSFLIPKILRKHVAVIYKFARQADDIADEGDVETSRRMEQLEEYRSKLSHAVEGNPPDVFWAALLNTISERKLNPQYFYNLLKAFEQDISKKRYKDFAELLGYCENSANPV